MASPTPAEVVRSFLMGTREVSNDALRVICDKERSDMDVFQDVWDYLNKPEFPGAVLSLRRKDDETARSLLLEADIAWKAEKYDQALEYLNSAVLVAEHPEEIAGSHSQHSYPQLAKVYFRRAQLFYALKAYSMAMDDLSRAEKYGFPAFWRSHLLEVKAKCHLRLGDEISALNCIKEALQSISCGESVKAKNKNDLLKLELSYKSFKNKPGHEGGDMTQERYPGKPKALHYPRNLPYDFSKNDDTTRSTMAFAKQMGLIYIEGEGGAVVATTEEGRGSSDEPDHEGRGSSSAAYFDFGHDDSLASTYSYLLDFGIPEIPKLERTNTSAPSLSDQARIKWSVTLGRHVVANKVIEPGEIILVEESSIAAGYGPLKSVSCTHCVKRTASPLPCYYCRCVLFCSNICREEAMSSYHRKECTVLDTIFRILCHVSQVVLTVRILYRYGYCNIKTNAQKYQAELQLRHRSNYGFNENGVYESDSYRTLYNLYGTKESPFPHYLANNCVLAVVIMKLLLQANFFEDESGIPFEPNQEDIVFLGSIVYKHVLAVQTNCFAINERAVGPRLCSYSRLGAALFGTASLFSHGCRKNAGRVAMGNTLVIFTTDRVPENGVISIDYGSSCRNQEFGDRWQSVFEYHGFLCNCSICEKESGPEIEAQIRLRPVFPKAEEIFDVDSALFKSSVLLNMTKETVVDAFKEETGRLMLEIQESERKRELEKFYEFFTYVRSFLNFIKGHLVLPCYVYTRATDLMGELHNFLAAFNKTV